MNPRVAESQTQNSNSISLDLHNFFLFRSDSSLALESRKIANGKLSSNQIHINRKSTSDQTIIIQPSASLISILHSVILTPESFSIVLSTKLSHYSKSFRQNHSHNEAHAMQIPRKYKMQIYIATPHHYYFN